MNLQELLMFARKLKATEMQLIADEPVEVLVGGELRRINLPALKAREFEAILQQYLGALPCEQLRATGRCESQFEVAGFGLIRAQVVTGKARLILPVSETPAEKAPQSAGTDRPPGAVPSFTERLRHLFGRNR
jgi:Tfp pilus assembly pilus retraction ATPase PilT